MAKVARGMLGAAWIVAGATALVGCSSTSTNEASGGASGASTGGASSGGASGASTGGASSGGASVGGAGGTSSGGASPGPVTCEKHLDCATLCGALEPVCPAVAGGMPYCLCYVPNGYCLPGETAKCPGGMTCNIEASWCSQTRGTQSGAACTKDLQCPPGELCDGTCRVPCELGTDAGCECEVVSPALPWGLCK